MAESKDLATLVLRFVAQTEQIEAGIRRVERDVRGFESRLSGHAKRIAAYFAGAFTIGAAISTIKQATRSATEFADAIDEVSTLLPSDTDMRPIVEGSKEMAKAFGSQPKEQAKAYYQIISAGATDAATATDILTAANKLAVGGVTDVFTAADGLTTILNAYGIASGQATEVTDAMFVAMKAGKTTIGELSRSIGQVAPIAAQTGVALDDLLATIAALTKGGIATSIATAGVRAILAAIAKPSADAVELSAQLGINFSAAGLKAKGFAGFLAEVKEKTGGSTESLAKLFGGVEALVPIMALSGNAGKDYATILGQMGEKAGQTEEAFRKMAESPGFKFAQFKAAITVIGIEFGTVILKVLVPAVTFLAKNIETIIDAVKVLAAVVVSRLLVSLTGLASSFVSSALAATALERAFGRLTVAHTLYATGASVATAATTGLNVAVTALGGPLGLLIAALTLGAAAWLSFGEKAEDSGDKAQKAIEGAVANIRDIKSAQATLNTVYDREIEIQKEISRLQERRKEHLDGTAKAAESVMTAMGDVANLETVEDIDKRILKLEGDRIENTKLLKNAQEKVTEIIKNQFAEEAKGKKIFVDPKVAEAQAKAAVKAAQEFVAEQSAILETSHRAGELSLAEYYERRQAIILEGLRKETVALEAAARIATPERKIEIDAEIRTAETKATKDILAVSVQQERSEEKINETLIERTKIREAGKVELDLAELKSSYDRGLVSVTEYYTRRGELATEATEIEIRATEAKMATEEDEAARQTLRNRIEELRNKQVLDRIRLLDEERQARRESFDEEKRISDEREDLIRPEAESEFERMQQQHADELKALEDRFAAERRAVEDQKNELIRFGEEYYEKEDALAKLAMDEENKRNEIRVRQAREVFEAKLGAVGEVFGMWGDAMGKAFEASGGKIKEFFFIQKAFSIVETTIKTYQAAVDAYRAMAALGPLGITLAPAAAAAAIAFGLAQVAIISRQQPPGFEEGGLIRRGSGLRDDVPIRVKRFEYVVRSEAVRHYGPEFLEAVNRMMVPVEMARFRAPVQYAPRFAYAEGGLVTGGGGINVDVSVPDTTLERRLEQNIRRAVVRTLREHS